MAAIEYLTKTNGYRPDTNPMLLPEVNTPHTQGRVQFAVSSKRKVELARSGKTDASEYEAIVNTQTKQMKELQDRITNTIVDSDSLSAWL